MKLLSPSSWRPKHLFAAWGTYWLTLIGVTLGPAIAAAWPAIHGPKGEGSVSANAGDEGVVLTIKSAGATIWEGRTTVGEILFWLTVPPLALFLVWLLLRPRAAERVVPGGVGTPTGPAALSEPPARTMPVPAAEREPVAEPRRRG